MASLNKSCSIVMMFASLFSLYAFFVQEAAATSNETDQAALLEFRSRISNDPSDIFSSWNDTIDFCHWQGVTCGRRHPRVTKLWLPNSRLGGSLSPFIGNLTFLRIINLRKNSFTSEIPAEIGNLHQLVMLSLDNNSFSGQLPENISYCTKLEVIRVRGSMLVGEIPRGLAALSELRIVHFSRNSFTGKFPDFFGNLSSLVILTGGNNNFRGTIPASLGRLKKLQQFGLYGNFFSGTIPTSIFNITSLEHIDFGGNQLNGVLPPNLGITLPNLRYLNFVHNHFIGLIPPSIRNASNLVMLQTTGNNFSGPVPDLKNLNRLEWLSISTNQLGQGTLGDLAFIESLNSTKLSLLAINTNNFGGTLPQSVGNLSSNLITLSFGVNRLTGAIPSSIGNLRNLETLIFGNNPMTGILPQEIGYLQKLKILVAEDSGFFGEIPSSFGNLSMIQKLRLSRNEFQGSIPASLGKCRNLVELDLSQNNLSGTIPWEIISISSMTIALDLSQNELSGALPDEVGDLKMLARLSVQENRLSGQVPNTLGGCTSLVELYMEGNLFEGNISSFLSPLKGLQYLDLSRNYFSGEIPEYLIKFQLRYLNLSFNYFEGEVPNQGVFSNATEVSVLGNANLCGGIPMLNLPRCPTHRSKHERKISSDMIVAAASVAAVLFVVLLFLATYIGINRYRRRNITSHLVSSPTDRFPQVSYEDIFRATGGFDQNNLIGVGSFGSVYKGTLEYSDDIVAIKVFDLRTQATSKSFVAECEELRNIRHRNLMKIFTVCSTIDFQGNEFKALVYEHMEKGSLEDWLHPKFAVEGVYQKLSLMHRLHIAIDIACAVKYLHHETETPIVHSDMKPGNILLDAEMTAHVGDFGLARVLYTDEVLVQSSSVGLRGTIGYSPPEYSMGCRASREGDVYSYGILLLEMFTGKRPTDDMFKDDWNIRSYCEAALPERATEIAEPYIFVSESGEGSSVCAPRRMQECLANVFEVGIRCCKESPGERMDIREAVTKLHRSFKMLKIQCPADDG